MTVRFKKTFFKDRDRLMPDMQSKVDELVFNILPNLKRISDLPNIKDIKGHKGYFRARIGTHRVGFESHGDEIIVHRVLNRREIYRYFP